MATFNNFNNFAIDLVSEVHNLNGVGGTDCDQLAVYLSNITPDASVHSIKADLAEITLENGYAGPINLSQNGTTSAGTFTVSADSVTISASGGTVGAFQYVVLMNNTATNQPLIAWWDYGSAITLADGESFVIKFSSLDTGGTIFTIS